MPRAVSVASSSLAPGELRRERHLTHGAGVEQTRELSRVRIELRLRAVHTEPRGRDERPLEVAPEHARADGIGWQLAQRCDELVDRRRHEGRLERSDAGREQRLACASVARRVRASRSRRRRSRGRAGRRSRNGDAVPGAREPDGRDPAVLDRDVTAHEDAVDEGRFDADPHALSMKRCSRPHPKRGPARTTPGPFGDETPAGASAPEPS